MAMWFLNNSVEREMGFWSLLGKKECGNLLTAVTQCNNDCSKCLKTIVTLSVSHFCVIETNSWGNFIKRTGLFWLSCRKKYLIRSLLGPAWPGLPPNPPTFRTLVYFPIVYRNKGKRRGWGSKSSFPGLVTLETVHWSPSPAASTSSIKRPNCSCNTPQCHVSLS